VFPSYLTCDSKTRSLNFAKRNWLPCAKIEFLQTEFGPEIAQGGAGRSTAVYA